MILQRMIGGTTLRLAVVAAVLFVLAPLLASILFSFQARPLPMLPLGGTTFDWYRQALGNPSYGPAILNSFAVATGVALCSTILGFCSAYHVCRSSGPFTTLHAVLAGLPGFMPPVITGICQRIWFQVVGMEGSLPAIIAAQTCFCAPFAFMIMFQSMKRLDRELESAAANLGASPGRIVLNIVLPQLQAPAAGAFLLTFLLAWDEFVIAFFVGGFIQTIPVLIFTRIANSSEPSLNALGVLLTGLSAMLLFIAVLVMRGTPSRKE